MEGEMNFDREKFRELLLYIARRSEDDPRFGATKLNKILFFADFTAFRRLGKAITGARYQKLPQGPAPRELLPLKAEMEHDCEIVEVERSYFGLVQRPIVARREPYLDRFSGPEIALVDEVLAQLRHLDARDVSELSHEFCGWQYTELRQDIPYDTALLTIGEPSANDFRIASELNREYGWTSAIAK